MPTATTILAVRAPRALSAFIGACQPFKVMKPIRLITKSSFGAFALAITLIAASGCKEKSPAEKAGEKIDKAVENTKDATKKGVEKVGDAAEKAGDKVKDATR